jgi:hypothetical protein
MRGVLGCSDKSSIAAWFLPVYFLGVGDLYDEAGLLVGVRTLPAGFFADSFGVVWTPVI